MTLRPYQRAAVKRVCRRLLADRSHVQVVSLPTGAGKTRVAVDVVLRFLRKYSEGRVLWLAPRWDLLAQAWAALRNVSSQYGHRAGRLGGGDAGPVGLPERADAPVLYTTLQTWYRRAAAGTLPPGLDDSPLLVVVDECHWAAEASLGQALCARYLGSASVLGLSATPKIVDRRYRITYARSYADLCPRYLAEPRIRQVQTGIEWSPVIEHGEYAPQSLAELGTIEERNELVVQEFLDGHNAGRYNRVLIFACDIRHANELARLLSEAGVSARAVHSGRSDRKNRPAIKAFRRGVVDVLVTVSMLAEGFDVPEIDAVFLARPTASLRLSRQMAGRGARRCRGKTYFWLVEFTDTVQRLGSQLFHGVDGLALSGGVGGASSGGAIRHEEPVGVPRFRHLDFADLPQLNGVTYVEGQTFGVEIELGWRGTSHDARGRWREIARKVIEQMHEAARLPVHGAPLGYHESDDVTKWRVCRDSSCGLEVVSPILVNREGFAELARVCGAIERLVAESPWLCINRHTGLPVTLATRLNTPKRLRGFAARLTRLEPGLYTLVAPSRLFECNGPWSYNRRRRNPYCKPVRELRGVPHGVCFDDLAFDAGRHRSVNLTRAADDMRLLEVRMHQGTTEARRIIPWIGLWMHIFNRARYSWQGPPKFGRVLPKGNAVISRPQVWREDIFRLLRCEGIVLGSAFETLLRDRRRELRASWERAVPQRVACWAAEGWYD